MGFGSSQKMAPSPEASASAMARVFQSFLLMAVTLAALPAFAQRANLGSGGGTSGVAKCISSSVEALTADTCLSLGGIDLDQKVACNVATLEALHPFFDCNGYCFDALYLTLGAVAGWTAADTTSFGAFFCTSAQDVSTNPNTNCALIGEIDETDITTVLAYGASNTIATPLTIRVPITTSLGPADDTGVVVLYYDEGTDTGGDMDIDAKVELCWFER